MAWSASCMDGTDSSGSGILLQGNFHSKFQKTSSGICNRYNFCMDCPVPLLCGNVIGSVGVSLGLGSDVLSSASDIAPYVYHVVFGSGLGSILFILMIFMAGLSTGGDVLSGAQSICTVVIFIRNISTKKQQKQIR